MLMLDGDEGTAVVRTEGVALEADAAGGPAESLPWARARRATTMRTAPTTAQPSAPSTIGSEPRPGFGSPEVGTDQGPRFEPGTGFELGAAEESGWVAARFGRDGGTAGSRPLEGGRWLDAIVGMSRW
jgi:hypothetical protein